MLTLLLGLVIHSGSRGRIALVGITFLTTTSLIYGAFITYSACRALLLGPQRARTDAVTFRSLMPMKNQAKVEAEFGSRRS